MAAWAHAGAGSRPAASPRAQADSLLARSHALESIDSARSRAMAQQVLALARRAGLDTLAVEAEYQLVRLLVLDPRPQPTALVRLRAVRAAAHRLGLWQLEARTFRGEGLMLIRRQDFAALVRVMQAELAILRAHHDHAGQADGYRSLAYVRMKQGGHGEALQLYMRALRHGRLSGDSLQRPLTLREIGALYEEVGDYPLAAAYMRAGRDAYARNHHAVGVAQLNAVLAVVHEQMGQDSATARYTHLALRQSRALPPEATADFMPLIYYCLGQLALRQRQPAAAIRYFRQAEPGVRLRPELDHLIFVLAGLAEGSLKLGRLTEAQRYAAEAHRLAQPPAYQAGLIKTEQVLAQLSQASGDYRAALAHERRAHRLADTLFTRTKNNQLAELRTRYANEQKEAQIRLLRRAADLQQTEATWERRHRNLLVGALVVVGVLGGASYRRYRLQRQTSRQLRQAQLQEQARNAELEQVQRQLRQSLDDKEVLLKEVHHRVKNNLQIIASLLALQAQAQARLPAVVAALREGQNWVKSIAMAHELLYQSDDLAHVDFGEFLARFVPHLQRTFAVPASQVQLRVQAEGIALGTDTAVPLGLIVNELLSNAFKYAYADGRAGTVAVGLVPDPAAGAGHYSLTVADDGPGLPANFMPGRASSLGLRLVHSLARQLGGELCLPPPGAAGGKFVVSFIELTQAPLPR
jgi:two-component sensor histidine kinase/tetratricopeptide (TPR) repeat protein